MTLADRPHGLLGLAAAAAVALAATPHRELRLVARRPLPAPSRTHTLAAIPGATALALDADHVYAIAGKAIVRVARGGGPVETLATADARELAVTVHYVWWIGAQGVERLAKATGERTLVSFDDTNVGHLAAVGDDVWFTLPRLDLDDSYVPLYVCAGEAEPRLVSDVTRFTGELTVPETRPAVVYASETRLAAFPIDAPITRVVGVTSFTPLALAGDRLVRRTSDALMAYTLDPEPWGPTPVTSRVMLVPRFGNGRTLGEGWLSGHGERASDALAATPAATMALDAVASDATTIAIATSAGFLKPPLIRDCSCAPPVLGKPHTGAISVVGPRGLETVVSGEEPIAALAIDERGPVWIADGALRATHW